MWISIQISRSLELRRVEKDGQDDEQNHNRHESWKKITQRGSVIRVASVTKTASSQILQVSPSSHLLIEKSLRREKKQKVGKNMIQESCEED